jgi:hypothetical protein
MSVLVLQRLLSQTFGVDTGEMDEVEIVPPRARLYVPFIKMF